MDSYQAVYDAARSRIGGFDGNYLVESIVQKFDFSFHADIIKDTFVSAAFEMQRPSVLLRPKLYIDGDQWCALYGGDRQVGVCGFGDSPSQAMDNFDTEYNKSISIEE